MSKLFGPPTQSLHDIYIGVSWGISRGEEPCFFAALTLCPSVGIACLIRFYESNAAELNRRTYGPWVERRTTALREHDVTKDRLAVVLFNLGGPDSPEAVRPFLFNLFNDPAIILLPSFLRWAIAQFISRKRAPLSREIYAQIGGQSNLLPNTLEQAEALKAELAGMPQAVEIFVFMRYWHPTAREVVSQIKAFDPDHIVLLPLYPQFSTTTVGTGIQAFEAEVARVGLRATRETICCYPSHFGFLDATVENIRQALDEARPHGRPRLLLSAHSLPEKTIAAGDPYQWQVEQTSRSIVDALEQADLDWVTCYQSRVGPLKWIGPELEEEVRRAGRDGVPVVIAPIAFVSEHVETLVEIEKDCREVARQSGVPHFVRVPAVASHCTFIHGLGDLVQRALGQGTVCSDEGPRHCPHAFKACPNTFGRNSP